MSLNSDDLLLEDPHLSLTPSPDEETYDSISSLAGGVMTLIYEIDLMLVEVRRLLMMGQPSIEGRIDFRWWKSRSGKGREPYVFEWAKRPNGRWYSKRLTGPGLARYAKRSGPFEIGLEETRAALSQIEKLINMRQDILGTVGKSRQVLSNKMNGAKTLLTKSGRLLTEKGQSAKEAQDARLQNYLEKQGER